MALERVESKKRQIGPRGSVSNTPGGKADSEARDTSKDLPRQDSKGSIAGQRRNSSKAIEGELSRQYSKEPQRVTSKLRRLGFKGLAEYEEGELEKEFVERVSRGDDEWVLNCLAAVGKAIIFSEWAGGVTKTTILYAAKQGDEDMCKILLAYGGKDLLKVKDLKNRDGEYFARLHGIDLLDLMHSSSRIDCWNHKALRQISKERKDMPPGQSYLPKSPTSTRTEFEMALTDASLHGGSSVVSRKGGA
ncbi:unnamed protein product [Amoebophrya sp. A25]|nr:unnamed protein product [Amoebophrya sp. A25]|eukprot:GSA25T00008422001.1